VMELGMAMADMELLLGQTGRGSQASTGLTGW